MSKFVTNLVASSSKLVTRIGKLKSLPRRSNLLLTAYCLLLLPFAALALPSNAYAQDTPKDQACDAIVDVTGGECIDKEDTGFGDFLTDLTNPLLRILSGLAIAGIILNILFGGAKYITSGGQAEKTAAAKTTITNALIGLVILLTFQLLLRLVFATAEEINNPSCRGLTELAPDGFTCIPSLVM